MNSQEILTWLNNTFAIDGYEIDKSTLSYKHLIPRYELCYMNDTFVETMSGCAMLLSNVITKVFFSTFLTDEAVESVCSESDGDAMIVVHHPFDMHCGTPGAVNAVPFHFIRPSSFHKLLAHNISLYSAHLPFDRQACHYNTSLTFANSMGFRTLNPLKLSSLPNIGYMAETKCDLSDLIARNYHKYVNYGVNYKFTGEEEKTAFIGGVVSCRAISEIESLEFNNLVCGDVLVRTGKQRYLETLDFVSRSRISILCISHLKSEQVAVGAVAEAMECAFPTVRVACLAEKTDWK